MVLEVVDRVLSAIHPRSFRALLRDLGATTRPGDYKYTKGISATTRNPTIQEQLFPSSCSGG